MTDSPAPPRVARQRRQKKIDPVLNPESTLAVTPPVAKAAPESTPIPAIERPPVRVELRADPRADAEARAAEIMGHIGGMDEGTDEFFVDPKRIPDGWCYEWKRKTVYGMEDPAYSVALARTGWTAVPATRHPEMMPENWSGNTIERKGQVLMERPQVITDMVNDVNKRRARDQVRVKEQQLNSAPKDQMPRAGDKDGDARTAPKVSKSYEPMPVPK